MRHPEEPIILIITISCVFFIIKLLINLLKKRRNEIFKGNPIIISIPLILNSILFLLGIVLKKYKEIQNFYYLGLIVDLILKASLARKSFDNVTCLFIGLKDFIQDKPNGIDIIKNNNNNELNNNININSNTNNII